MKRRHILHLIAVVVVLNFTTTACLDELGQFLEFVVWETSDDPQLQRRAAWQKEEQEGDEVWDLKKRYLATGDVSALESALEIRPHDDGILALLLLEARKSGDQDSIRDAERRLAYANAMPDEDETGGSRDSPTANDVRDDNTYDILRAQVDLLGVSIWDETWTPPGPAGDQGLFDDYCDTRTEVRTEFGDRGSAWWLNGPACP